MAASTFTIQYMSNLHIELLQKPLVVTPAADYLALCGDIGNPFQDSYRRFLVSVSGQFKKVFLVAGNHEYYNNEFFETNKQIDLVCKELENVVFLNNCEYILELTGSKSIRILGTTLWSNVTPAAFASINDSRKIRFRCAEPNLSGGFMDHKMTQQDAVNLHQECVKFVMESLGKSNIPTLILSHHAWSHKMNGDYAGNAVQSAFSTDLESLVAGKNVVGIISGHTHQSVKMTLDSGKIQCVENAYGYTPSERSRFDGSATLTVSI